MVTKITDAENAPAARANRLGEPCPPWCAADHDAVVLERDGADTVYAHAHASRPITDDGPFAPRVYVGEFGADARVCASSLSRTLHVLPGYQAEELAGFLEQLASYTPDQLRRMAADVRAAAAIARGSEAAGGAR